MPQVLRLRLLFIKVEILHPNGTFFTLIQKQDFLLPQSGLESAKAARAS